jgi:hypothetical protein
MENRQFRANNGEGAFCKIADVELKETVPGNILDPIFSPQNSALGPLRMSIYKFSSM